MLRLHLYDLTTPFPRVATTKDYAAKYRHRSSSPRIRHPWYIILSLLFRLDVLIALRGPSERG
jgi:hypothetical protein